MKVSTKLDKSFVRTGHGTQEVPELETSAAFSTQHGTQEVPELEINFGIIDGAELVDLNV